MKHKHWREAMFTEMKALMKSNTWVKVAKINTVRVLFSIAANKDWPIHQFDVTNAFLKKRDGKITCLIVYVDDMIITGDDEEEISELRKNLFKEFEMKDLGLLKYFLGIEVLRSKRRIFINQRKYILDLLAEIGMIDCKPADAPIVQNHGLQLKKGGRQADRGRYQRLVGKLIYLSHTKPDIAYVVGVVSQFMHAPQEEHWEAALRIVRYLKGTPEHRLMFEKHGHMEVHGFTDADWAGNPNDRKSTASYFTFVGDRHFIKENIEAKVVEIPYVKSEDQLADILTKAVNSKSFREIKKVINKVFGSYMYL
ncbi:uncharacterized mitochondrial protein AtMg00810-like [Salvia splendens]|uniref:uncharacterized mitochondrial protein AtMg00810-like n=1 Tax=Salvia splendens TaxID=180675 RepID=UPI001C275E5B|nr:uncharacterized mitochondrial protein AtMg00810-like [Salvia splendens]